LTSRTYASPRYKKSPKNQLNPWDNPRSDRLLHGLHFGHKIKTIQVLLDTSESGIETQFRKLSVMGGYERSSGGTCSANDYEPEKDLDGSRSGQPLDNVDVAMCFYCLDHIDMTDRTKKERWKILNDAFTHLARRMWRYSAIEVLLLLSSRADEKNPNSFLGDWRRDPEAVLSVIKNVCGSGSLLSRIK
jgi:hypothetical protein